KFINPEHAAAVFAKFYFIPGLSNVASYILGGIQSIAIAAFVMGFQKTWSYSAVLLMHGVSTVSSYQQFLSPYADANILFFAALPMLAGCVALFILRDYDNRWVIDRSRVART
ncbi:MAG: hypothetical protein AAFX40_18025, partial [Cyanobacteria bacterium J06639_1]